MSTPHNKASKGDIAKTVLMPGDPLRAKYLAEHYLEDVTLFNDVRNMYGYTGYYKDKRVSIMGSGMGIPSISIYATELYNQYDVETIIRIGSCGGMQKDIHIRDLIIAQGACTDSRFAHQFKLPGTFSAIATYDLLEKAVSLAKQKGVPYHVGNIISSDLFYHAETDKDAAKLWGDMGVMGVEMETYALYTLAAYYNKKAIGIMTVSDSLVNQESESTPEEREKTFTAMMEIALEVAE